MGKTSSGGAWVEGAAPAGCITLACGLLVEMQVLSLHTAPCFLCSGGNEIKPQIYTSYAMFFMAVSTALRKMRKIPNVSVDYAVAQCGNLKRAYNLSRNGGRREAWVPPPSPGWAAPGRVTAGAGEMQVGRSHVALLEVCQPAAPSEGWSSGAPTKPSVVGRSH